MWELSPFIDTNIIYIISLIVTIFKLHILFLEFIGLDFNDTSRHKNAITVNCT